MGSEAVKAGPLSAAIKKMATGQKRKGDKLETSNNISALELTPLPLKRA